MVLWVYQGVNHASDEQAFLEEGGYIRSAKIEISDVPIQITFLPVMFLDSISARRKHENEKRFHCDESEEP